MEQFDFVIGDPRYPRQLASIVKAPPFLYGKGEPALLNAPCIAIVGTRKASGQGLAFAKQLASDLAKAGLVIVSGLAQGVDGAAHEGALDAGGKTVGVLASSLEERLFFPPSHRALRDRMLQHGGAIISEHKENQPALRPLFAQRNRIVSGLCLGVVVIESPLKGGSLITAAFAKSQSRLVFAVPGSPFNNHAQGTNMLIKKKGALLIEGAKDVLQALAKADLFKAMPVSVPTLFSKEESDPIALALAQGQLHIDKLAQKTKVEVPKLLVALMELELQGKVKHIGGGMYVAIRS